MELPKQLTTVTRFSKTLAIIIFVTFPFVGFWLGIKYQRQNDTIKFGNDLLSYTKLASQTRSAENSVNKFADLKLPLLRGVAGYSTYIIPETNLTITIPSIFKTSSVKAGMQAKDAKAALNFSNNTVTYAYNDINKEAITADIGEELTIYAIKTDLKPLDWLSENITFQGQKFVPDDSSVKRTTINGRPIYITYTSCCGGYTPTYIFEYQNTKNENMLIILTTDTMTLAKTDREGNYLLDYLETQISDIK